MANIKVPYCFAYITYKLTDIKIKMLCLITDKWPVLKFYTILCK